MQPQAQRGEHPSLQNGNGTGINHPVLRDILGKGPICAPLLDRLSEGREHAAFEYLFRETSFDTINHCLSEIRDQEVAHYLLDGVLQIGSLLSSEAFIGIERIRRELKTLMFRSGEDLSEARRVYDSHVEVLGQYLFAIGRRLQQIEAFFASCPFSGSAEQIRGLYGQRVRDLAGDLRFLRMGLDRWVRKFVPFERELPEGEEGRELLEARITTVVDDLALRLNEVQESFSFVMFEQLTLFDETLTRKSLFKRDLENHLDLDHFLSWFGELISRVRDYDEQRRPEQLEGIQFLLRDFHPEQFPALAGMRESDHILFSSFVERLRTYRHTATGPLKGQKGAQAEDPVHPFLLLLGDLFSSLNQRAADQSPMDPSPF